MEFNGMWGIATMAMPFTKKGLKTTESGLYQPSQRLDFMEKSSAKMENHQV
jgi:hypothetical protein